MKQPETLTAPANLLHGLLVDFVPQQELLQSVRGDLCLHQIGQHHGEHVEREAKQRKEGCAQCE
jgi:hypothetical protein